MKPSMILLAPLVVFALLGTSSHVMVERQPFSGTYVLDKEASDDVVEAFEPVLQELNFVTRRIARSRLQEDAQPDKNLRIHQSETEVTIQSGDSPAMTTPLSGEMVDRETEQGGKVKVRTRIVGPVLEQHIVFGAGSQTNRYRLSSDGQRLTNTVRLVVDRLPRPVTYRLVYNRAGH